ncbi:hypothetical protein lerEdw1_010159 [Lerista edwardsae]|nr:hypothetical protein lerEdw1_010159 [Lerista edwardsae]
MRGRGKIRMGQEWDPECYPSEQVGSRCRCPPLLLEEKGVALLPHLPTSPATEGSSRHRLKWMSPVSMHSSVVTYKQKHRPQGAYSNLSCRRSVRLKVVDIMRVNVDKVLERDQKLSELDDRADALQAGASQFETSAAKLKRKYWWKNLKMMIILGVICAIILIIIIVYFST